jgi:pilus assembly protein CpaC
MTNCCLVREWLNKFGLAIFFLLFSSAESFAAQPQATPTVAVTVNKSMVFRLAEKAKRVSVSQPEVADVIVVAPTQLLINGKAVGTTSLIIFDEKGEVTNYDLVVGPDTTALRGQFRVMFPEEKVEVSTSGPNLVLRGEVSNEVIYDKVLEIAQSYLPPKPPAAVAPSTTTSVSVGGRQSRPNITGISLSGGGNLAFEEESSLHGVDRWEDKRKIEGIIDLLVIKDVRQIEVDVIVAEVQMNKLREVGFDITQSKGLGTTQSFASDNNIGSLAGLVGTGLTSGSFAWVNGAYRLTALYRLLQNKDITEILAQPRLVMKNGRSGTFLAGGEFPVAQTLQDSFSVEFKPFGVKLDFVPTITWSDRIDLRVYPEVSEIDPTIAVNGIPGLKVRRTVNRVEMNDGESLIIGGLLDRRITKSLSKFPLLGDVPILGALFRSTSFQNFESELVFVITPRIVRTMKPGEKPQLPAIEKYDDPDIRQVPLPRGDEKNPAAKGATIP